MGGMRAAAKIGKIKTTPVMVTDIEIVETMAIAIKVINLAHRMDHKTSKQIFYTNIQ